MRLDEWPEMPDVPFPRSIEPHDAVRIADRKASHPKPAAVHLDDFIDDLTRRSRYRDLLAPERDCPHIDFDATGRRVQKLERHATARGEDNAARVVHVAGIMHR
jgi:hypothetical protein